MRCFVLLLATALWLAPMPPPAAADDAQPTPAVSPQPPPAVIPLPNAIAALPGRLHLPQTVTIVATDAAARDAASFVVADLAHRGITARIAAAAASTAPSIDLRTGAADPQLGDEGYRLRIDATGVAIAANAGAGLFYGAQTLAQLLVTSPAHDTSANGVAIVDRPRFAWRGIHLDVSRHFFPAPVVEQFIDVAARYKLNRFHWHLTDDQGWRMPIPGYPLLTSTGACRSGSQIGGNGATTADRRRYCGAYTSAQIREVVAYAARRHVTVVPEIEMPGHSNEAL